MPGLDENQKIQRITDLLVKGGTMLANHHDCGAPMFRYRGEIICPVCDMGGENTGMPGKEEAAVSTRDGQETREKKPSNASGVEQFEKIHPGTASARSNIELENHVLNKLNVLAGTLEQETDLQRLRDKMECIELGIRILKELKN